MTVPKDKDKFDIRYLIAGDGVKDWFKAWGGGIKLLVTLAIPALLIYVGFNWGWREHAKKHPSNVYHGPTTVIQSVPEKKPAVRFEIKLWWLDLDLHGGQPK